MRGISCLAKELIFFFKNNSSPVSYREVARQVGRLNGSGEQCYTAPYNKTNQMH